MAVNVELALARLAEAQQIALMSRDLIEAGLGWRWTPARVTRQIRCPDTNVLVARSLFGRSRGRVIGFAIMHFRMEEAHLLLLAVHPAYRHGGIGRRLVEWQEKVARTAGIPTIHLEVRANNHAARAFYRALGYQEVQLVPRYYDGRESAVRMAHDLRVTP